jgi:hypothetical protein
VVPVVLLAYRFVRNPDVFWRLIRVSQMPQPSTLSYIADLIIRRVLAEEHRDLAAALERAYPFDDCLEARRIWLDALLRHAVASAHTVH